MNRELALEILEAIPIGLAIIRKSDREIIWVSSRLRELFLERGEPVGRRCHEFFLQHEAPCPDFLCPIHHHGTSFHDLRHGVAGVVPRVQASPINSDYYLYTMTEETELFRRIEYFKTLLTINRYIHSTLTLDEILSIVLLGITAGEGLGFNRAFLFLPDPEEKFLRGHLAVGPRDAQEAGRIWGEVTAMNLSLEAILERFPRAHEDNDILIQWIRNQVFDLNDMENPLVRIYREGSALEIIQPPNPVLSLFESPRAVAGALHFHGISHGVFFADNRFTGSNFTADTLEFLEVISLEAGAAMSNSTLYQERERALTELQTSQQKLVAAERMSALGEVTAAVAHEIRNPIVTLGLILKNHKRVCGREDTSDIDAMQQTLLGLERLLKNYLLLSYKPEISREKLDLTQFLSSIIRLMSPESESRKVSVAFYPDSEPITVMWDAVQIQEVFLNLFANAYAAMPEGGTITISTHAVEGDRVRITFSDSGSGIPSHVRDRVFQPYFTTKTTGTGIGLALSARVVTDHGGQIWLDDVEQEGTTFILEIPRGEQ
ncbi:MAG TPA: ATP-binding protein [Thermoanaerobaculia bacterium]|nr:ATP-binding protein [Thermoanaerobaculia bacterium]HUM29890.1 ATP-binding protein [Thermoanaerobaculia bacterium]HXK68243.1 ATP-binding protein [Thermoanaerobaculia bacterium]